MCCFIAFRLWEKFVTLMESGIDSGDESSLDPPPPPQADSKKNYYQVIKFFHITVLKIYIKKSRY